MTHSPGHCGENLGFTPRPSGSLLVMRGEGRFEGSVTGGSIEDDLLARFYKTWTPIN